MMSGVFGVFIFFAVIAITVVVFIGWIVYTIVRAILGGAASVLAPRTSSALTMQGASVRCATRGCSASNPAQARFCRRCGRGMPGAHRVQVRRAAVW